MSTISVVALWALVSLALAVTLFQALRTGGQTNSTGPDSGPRECDCERSKRLRAMGIPP